MEKIKQLKYTIFEIEGRNRMLRRDLLRANKVMQKEIPETNLRRIVHGKEFRGQEEEAIQLRQKIDKLRLHIRELEDEPFEQPQEPECCCRAPTLEKNKNRDVAMVIPANQQEKFRLYETCCKIKSKFEYWKVRNKELAEDADKLRLELNQLLENEKKIREEQNTYDDVERQLQVAMNEKLNVRSQLDCFKTKNSQLAEESASLKEDLKKMDGKIKDDNMLLEALTSQQDTFQEFIDQQKLIIRNNHHLFLTDMKNVEIKHKTTLSECYEMEELIKENGAILSEFEDNTPLVIDITIEDKPPETPSQTTVASDIVEGQPIEDPLKELKNELEIWVSDVEQRHAENVELKETIYDNNDRLIDWIGQLLVCETKLIESEIEIKKLKMATERGEKGCREKPKRLKNIQQTKAEDYTIEQDIYLTEYYVLERFLSATESLSTNSINLYVVAIDKMIRMFVNKLCDMRREFFSKVEASANAGETEGESRPQELPEDATDPQ